MGFRVGEISAVRPCAVLRAIPEDAWIINSAGAAALLSGRMWVKLDPCERAMMLTTTPVAARDLP